MVAALHILSLRVCGWKAISDSNQVFIDFRGDNPRRGQSCLITGPNESGKSSTFSALRYALFELYSRGGEATKNWVNYEAVKNNEPAEIEVELLINGLPYTIKKQRKQGKKSVSGSSEFFNGIGTGKDLIARGRPADEKILELIGARSAGTREEENPSSWGLLAWLLAPQGMDSIEPARGEGIDALGLERSVDEDASKLYETILADLKGILTEDRREPKGEFATKKEVNDQLKKNLRDLENQMTQFSSWLEEVSRMEANLVKLQNRVENVNEDWDAFNQTGGIQEDTRDAQEKERLFQLQASQQKDVHTAKSALNSVSTKEDDLRKAKKQVSSLTKKEGAALTKKNEQLEISRNLDSAKEKLKTDRDKLKGQLKNAVDLYGAAKKHNEYLQAVEAHKILTRCNEEFGTLLNDGEILEETKLDELRDLLSELKFNESVLEYKKEASAWIVDIEKGFKPDVLIDGEPVSPGTDALPLLDNLTIRTSDEKEIVVRPASDSDISVEKQSKLMEALAAHGYKSVPALQDAVTTESDRIAQHKRLLDIIEQHPPLDEIQNQINSLQETVRADAPQLDLESIENERSDLDTSIEKIQAKIDLLDQERKEQAAVLARARKKFDEITEKRKIAENTVETTDRYRISAIEEYGSINSCKSRLKDAETQLAGTQRLIEQIEDSEDLKRSARRSEYERLRKNKDVAEKELRYVEIDLSRLKNKLDEAFAEDINTKIHEMSEKLRIDTIQFQKYERSVRARDALASRIREKLTNATNIETAPIRDKVQSWLHAVTEGKWTDIELSPSLEVLGIGGPMDAFLPREDTGSHGLQQVIHALIRLAVATHIYDTSSKDNPDFPPVTIVMDESQGHVDGGRVSLLMERFNRAIAEGKIQVIALSHRGDEFRSLHPVIEYDMKRRQVREFPED